MKSFVRCAALAALTLSAGFAYAGNNLVVASADKGQTAFSADAMLDGQAVGLQFSIKITGATEKSRVNLDNCLKALPKSHTGSCGLSADKTVVTGLVFSLSNAKLPAGVLPLGTVHVASGEKVSFEVVEFLVAGDAGRQLDAVVQDAALK